MGGVLENSNPAVFVRIAERTVLPQEEDDSVHDEIDAREVFDIPFPALVEGSRSEVVKPTVKLIFCKNH